MFCLLVHLFESILSTGQPPSSFCSPLLKALATGRKCVTARSSWAILRNFFYSHTCIHTQNPGDMSAKGKTGDQREGESEEGEEHKGL